MKKETTPKKAWKKPEVQDLDVKNTASGANTFNTEASTSSAIFAPAAS